MHFHLHDKQLHLAVTSGAHLDPEYTPGPDTPMPFRLTAHGALSSGLTDLGLSVLRLVLGRRLVRVEAPFPLGDVSRDVLEACTGLVVAVTEAIAYAAKHQAANVPPDDILGALVEALQRAIVDFEMALRKSAR